MPGKDEDRWQQNEDGSWSRKPLEGSVTETVSYQKPAAAEPADDSPNATTGAIEAADELGVDLANVEGTGKDGKITKADVESGGLTMYIGAGTILVIIIIILLIWLL